MVCRCVLIWECVNKTHTNTHSLSCCPAKGPPLAVVDSIGDMLVWRWGPNAFFSPVCCVSQYFVLSQATH